MAFILGQGGLGVSGGGGGSNASVGATGAPSPNFATEVGIIVAGNLVGISSSNPVPISGTVTASNPSVGSTGSTAPTSATEIGVINNSGNLVGISASNPLRIDPVGTTVQPVSGTITANQGGAPWADNITQWNSVTLGSPTAWGTTPSGNVIGANVELFAGSAALSATGSSLNVNITGGSSGNAAAGATSSPVPSYADYIGFNSGGNLIGVSSSNPLPVDVTNTVPVSGTFWQATQPVSIASMPTTPVKPDGTVWTLTGTSANVDVTNTVAVSGTFWQATQPVSIASMPTTPVKPDGTVWTLTSTSANVNITNSSLAVTGTFWQATQPVSGTVTADIKGAGGATLDSAAGTSNSQALTIQGNASGIAVPVSGTFWQATQPVSIASMPTTPVKPDGTIWTLTGTSANVDVTNTVTITGTIAATQSTNPWIDNVTQWASTVLGAPTTYGTSPSGVVIGVNAYITNSPAVIAADSSPTTINITAQDTSSTTVSGADGQSIITGTPTANSAAVFAVSGLNTVRVQITGTWTGTLQFEFSMDGGTTWYISSGHVPGTAYTTGSTTANGSFGCSIAAATNFRVRAIAAWTGTATVTVRESSSLHLVDILTPVQLWCSSSGALFTIKPTSTAPVSTDTSIVVALNPNAPLPSGSNTIGAVTQASGPWTINLTQVDGTTLGAPTTYGTAPSGSVIGVNAYITNVVPVSGTFWQATQPVSIASLPSLPSGSNTIGAVTQASPPWAINLTQVDSTVLGAPSTWGTAPSGVVIGVNAELFFGSTAVSAGNPLPITGSISATNPSVGSTGTTAPTSATEIGFVNASGNLTAPSSSSPLPTQDAGNGVVGAPAPTNSSIGAYANAQGLTTQVTPTTPLPVQTDAMLLQIVNLLTRMLACLESQKVMDGMAYGTYESTDNYYDQTN